MQIRVVWFWSLLMCMFLGTAFCVDKPPTCKQKTLLVLSCKGGGGHTAAAHTLQKLLGEEYAIQTIYPIDQLRIWGIKSGEQLYNAMLQSGWTRSMNFIVRYIAPHLFRSREEKMEQIITNHIDHFEPDLIVSLIPFVNYPASEAARKKNIPYLLITTDNDLRHWVLGLEKLKHPDFKVTIGSDLTRSRELLLKKKIPHTAIETIGLPVRPEFIREKDEKRIREEFAILDDRPVTLIMMGGAGSNKVYDYAKRIGMLDLSTHIIVIMGKDEKISKELKKIALHPSNTMTLLGYTDRVADLMAISQVVVTKPGPGTISEAIAMHLPVLIDNTGNLLFWERINVDMVLKYGIGQRITDSEQIAELMETYLGDAEIRQHLKSSFVAIPPNRFHQKIKGIIEGMLLQNASQPVLNEEVESELSLSSLAIPSEAL